jgi:Ca-activated chloride channel family protein
MVSIKKRAYPDLPDRTDGAVARPVAGIPLQRRAGGCALHGVDAKGAVVGDLTRDDFRVYDNGVRRMIENFWFDRDLPVTLGILIDATASQEQQPSEHRQTTSELLRRILRPGDRAFVISVAEEVRLWMDLTAAGADIDPRMAGLPSSLFGQPCEKRGNGGADVKPVSQCGASPLWNALHDAARIQMCPLTGSKALLTLTDGFDSGSTYTWWQAVDEAARADNAVYAIQKIRHDLRVETARPGLTVRGRKTYLYDRSR